MTDTIKVEVDSRGIVQLRLNRREKRNALSAEMIADLTAFAGMAAERRDWRAIILSGEGAAFCAGGISIGCASKWRRIARPASRERASLRKCSALSTVCRSR